ncbi:UvrB/UvrC motif-containing protein [bacterium]|nr:UvrB/UvrC motif-containing protein [bacterium]
MERKKRICDVCGEREGVITVVQYIGGVRKKLFVCLECAAKVGVDEQLADEQVVIESAQELEHTCPMCGWKLKDVVDTGMLGCPNCYEEFYDEVVPLLEHFHGRGCLKRNVSIALRKDLTTLQWQLRKAVDEERFEDAAYFRDLIKKVEDEIMDDEIKSLLNMDDDDDLEEFMGV